MNSRRRATGCAWLWLLALLPVGCSRAPAVVPAQPVEAHQFRLARGGVSVGVDPYFTTDRLVQTFRGGDKFSESGVLPVQVTIENRSRGEVTIDPRDFRLLRPNSAGDAPLTAQDAFTLVKIRIRYWALLPIVGDSVTAARNEPILKDLESRELKETTIPSGGLTTGFVYFQLPEEQRNLEGTLVGVVVKGPSGQDLTYAIPIEGRRDIPISAAPTQSAGSPPPSKPLPLDPKVPSSPLRIEGAGGGVIIRSPPQ